MPRVMGFDRLWLQFSIIIIFLPQDQKQWLHSCQEPLRIVTIQRYREAHTASSMVNGSLEIWSVLVLCLLLCSLVLSDFSIDSFKKREHLHWKNPQLLLYRLLMYFPPMYLPHALHYYSQYAEFSIWFPFICALFKCSSALAYGFSLRSFPKRYADFYEHV